jgi:hypothetical protein
MTTKSKARGKKKMSVETVELTVSVDYVSNWSTRHGVREIFQNAIDAEKVMGNRMEVVYERDLLRLRIVTHDAKLEMKTLLLGVSEKGGEGAIGRYGEGYKVGVLAMIRDGKRVEIRTGTQLWKPRLDRSASFGVPTLHFDIESGHDDFSGIEVCIHGIMQKEWDEYRLMFRHTSDWSDSILTKLLPYWEGDPRRDECRVLLGEEQKGRLYVGGIFVTMDEELEHGYDLPPESFCLDRDRDVIRRHELDACMGTFWQSVFVDAWEAKDSVRMSFVVDKIKNDDRDAQSIKTGSIRSQFHRALVAWIRQQHGENVYPVPDTSTAHQAKEAGVVATVIPAKVHALVSNQFPSLADLRKRRESEVVRSWSVDTLEKTDNVTLRWAWDMVVKAGKKRLTWLEPKNLPMPQIAEFRSENVEGVNAGGLIFVKKDMLKQKGRLIVTLVHEYIHQVTGKHDEAMLSLSEQIYEEIIGDMVSDVDHDAVACDAAETEELTEKTTVDRAKTTFIQPESGSCVPGSDPGTNMDPIESKDDSEIPF